MNDIYIDANVNNSFNKTADNSEYTYKLSEPLELPKGTNISIQQSFINKKGITGGSIEITDDIYEVVQYIYYLVEQGHHQPLGDIEGPLKDWCRTTLCTTSTSFVSNWDIPQMTEHIPATYNPTAVDPSDNTWLDDTNRILFGEEFIDTTKAGNYGCDYWKTEVSGLNSGTCFSAYGGNNMVLPQVKYKLKPGTTGANRLYYMVPNVKELEIYIPRGVYGISELGNLIQDYFNGEASVGIKNGVRFINKKSKFQQSMEDVSANFDDPFKNRETLDGQPYNPPTLDWMFIRQDRDYDHAIGNIIAAGTAQEYAVPLYKGTDDVAMEGFTSMDCYNELLNFSQTYGSPEIAAQIAGTPDTFNWANHRGANAALRWSTAQNDVRPFYWLSCPEQETAQGTKGKADSDASLEGYNTNGYSAEQTGTRTRDSSDLFKRLIGTSNFQFTYNTEKNGYEIKGLHQVCYAASHNSRGVPNSSNGKQVVNLKRINEQALGSSDDAGANPANTMFKHYASNGGYFLTNAGAFTIQTKKNRNNIIAQLNSPESRMGGIMILNWAKEHSKKTGDTNIPEQLDIGTRFDQSYSTEQKARKAWEDTLWFKLGFTYDQLANRDNYRKQRIYNKTYDNIPGGSSPWYFGGVNGNQDCGFTTDATVDNSVVPTISTLNCPVEIPAAAKTSTVAATPARTNFQIYGYGSIAIPKVALAQKTTTGSINEYSNSLYRGVSTIPVAIADVGGITAQNLPTLSQECYYLITSDLCDNFKDNVKKGDPIALLGVVAKSNLSNQDFIVDKDNITQVISQDKIVNSIKIKILNPDLTAPILDRFSSVLLKIQRPNITPTSLLLPKQLKMIEQETATM